MNKSINQLVEGSVYFRPGTYQRKYSTKKDQIVKSIKIHIKMKKIKIKQQN